MARFAVLYVVVTSFMFGGTGGHPLHAQPLAKGKWVELDYLGDLKVVRKPDRDSLSYFPDEGIAVLGRDPLRFLLVAGDTTWLMEGKTWETAEPVRKMLEPSRDGPDNGYAGVGAVHLDHEARKVLAFYHAEDHRGYGKLQANDVQNFMSSICLADSSLAELNFVRRGPVLTTHQKKNPKALCPQGVGDVSVAPSPDGKYLYAWYSDHSRVGRRGVQICMARVLVADAGKPDGWRKYHEGAFTEAGLGGRETPVLSLQAEKADAWAPNVSWVPECSTYVMVFNATVYVDFAAKGELAGGIWMAHSADGVQWSRPLPLVRAFGLPMPGKQCAIHPTFVVNRATPAKINGDLLYGYSPKWGHTDDSPPHHLVRREVTFRVTPQ